MTPSTRPAAARLRITMLIGLPTALTVGAVVALTGCAASGQGSSATTSSAPSTTSTGGSSDECATGEFDVVNITGTESVDVEGQRIVFSGEATGLVLTLAEATWELSGDDARATVDVAGVDVDATIDGSAGGSLTSSGQDLQFALERSAGSATISLEGIASQRLDMDEVTTALAPVGEARLTCTAGGATLESESVTLELRRVSGTTSTTGSTSNSTATSTSR